VNLLAAAFATATLCFAANAAHRLATLAAMLGFLTSLLAGHASQPLRPAREFAVGAVQVGGLAPFPLQDHLQRHHGFSVADWAAARAWIGGRVPVSQRRAAWTACKRAWLLHFREVLGPRFNVEEGASAFLLSSLDTHVSRATLACIERTRRHIGAVLNGLVHAPERGKDVLIVFDTASQYCDYVLLHHKESGELAVSGGTYIDAGCGHFVTVKKELATMEPTIAREMTHGALHHLPLPAWLNEGIAVNTEQRLARAERPLRPPEQMRGKHLRFWDAGRIQELWSGRSFERTDDGRMLSYDLARILVERLSRPREPFKAFVRAAHLADAGAAAAYKHLGISLGTAVCALLERTPAPDWHPEPHRWRASQRDGVK
jgi:hypothetical protein